MIKYTCGAGTPEEAETNCTYFIRGECTSSFCEYRRKKQTNADCIRSMNDEEMCNWLFQRDCRNIAAFLEYGGMGVLNAVQLLEWLQQPAE